MFINLTSSLLVSVGGSFWSLNYLSFNEFRLIKLDPAASAPQSYPISIPPAGPGNQLYSLDNLTTDGTYFWVSFYKYELNSSNQWYLANTDILKIDQAGTIQNTFSSPVQSISQLAFMNGETTLLVMGNDQVGMPMYATLDINSNNWLPPISISAATNNYYFDGASIWVSDNRMLTNIDMSTGNPTTYMVNEDIAKPLLFVNSELWIPTAYKLIKLSTSSVINLPARCNSLFSNGSFIWCTYGSTVYKFDPATEAIISAVAYPNTSIHNLLVDSSNQLWAFGMLYDAASNQWNANALFQLN